jgi:hypothetical protein
MIHLIGDLLSDKIAQVLQINNKSCVRVNLTGDSHNQIIVVAMPVFIGTRTKYFFIFFVRPGGVGQLVRSIKMLFSGYKHDHGANITLKRIWGHQDNKSGR